MTEVPLREPAFLILTALADQPQHGYGVIEEVRRISDGQLRLQAGTRPGQRYPRLRESLDLLTTATWRRLGHARAGFTDSRWADASAVLGVLATILLCGKAVRPISSALAYHIAFYGYAPYQVHWSLTLRAALWAGVTVAVLGGWRRIATPAAWFVVCTDAVLLLARHPDQRLDPLTWWPTMLEAI